MALLLLGYGNIAAREIRQGDQCVVGANEVITGNLFVLCRTLIIYGRVEGNVLGAATTAHIQGVVTGDVYLASGQLDIDGTIGKNLHFAGPVLRVLPAAKFEDKQADLLSLSLSTTVADGATIPGTITGAGYQLVLDGNTGGEINFWGSALTLNGRAGGDVDANVGDPQSTGISQLQTLLIPFSWDVQLINPGLLITERGSVEGNLRYAGPTEGKITGKVTGQTSYNPVIVQPTLNQIINEEQGGLRVYLSQAAREFLTLAIVGALWLMFAQRSFQLPIRQLQSRPLPSIGVGLLTFILSFPVILIIVLLSVLVIFILSLFQLDSLLIGGGILLGIINIGGASFFYFIAVFVSRVVVCLALGRFVLRVIGGENLGSRALFASMLIGVAVLALLGTLPVIGWIINAIFAFLGLGAILLVLQAQLRRYRDVPPGPPLRTAANAPMLLAGRDNSRAFPPPIIDDGPRSPGTDNLPDGFKWWDD